MAWKTLTQAAQGLLAAFSSCCNTSSLLRACSPSGTMGVVEQLYLCFPPPGIVVQANQESGEEALQWAGHQAGR